MVKLRLMGTVEEIAWVTSILETEDRFEIVDSSDSYPIKGSKRYFRTYLELEKKNKEISEE